MPKTAEFDNALCEVIKASGLGIAQLAADGSYVYCNDSWATFAGQCAAELKGRSILDSFDGQSGFELSLLREQATFERGAPIRKDLFLKNAKGELHHLSIEARTMRCPESARMLGLVLLATSTPARGELERRLLLAESRLAAFSKTDMLAVTYFNQDGTVHEPNQKFYDMYEVDRDKLAFYDWRKADPDVWQEQTRQALIGVLGNGRNISFLKEIKTMKGKILPVNVTIAPLIEEDPYDWMAISYDLTELVEAREDAESNRHKADLALEAAKIGLWEFDFKSRVGQWDERCCHMLGVKKTETDDMSIFEGRVSKEDIERIRDTMLVALDGEFGHSQTVEFKILVNGREKILSATGRGFHLFREETPRLTGTLTDVTAARKYEQRLFESEDRFRTMAEAIPQIVFEANTDGEVEWVNRKFYDYSGLSEVANPTQQNINDAIHPEDLEAMRNSWKGATCDGRPIELQYRLKSESGDYKWFLLRALPVVDARGNIQRWIGSCTDIDQQKRLADELKIAKEAAERANKMKSSFLANMSHEIRTPLGAILGFTELMADEDLKEGEQAEFLRIIARNGQTLSRIVDDILDLSKVEAGMLPLERVQLSPAPLIKEVVDLFNERAKAKGLELKFSADPNVPRLLISDPIRIRQIVSNLISNAIKFTEQGFVEVSVSASKHEWSVRVCDTGIGIRPDQISRLFKPFQQGDDSMNRKFGGTGLGLHLSRRLAEAMGGGLAIDGSASVFGSCFRLNLPIETAASVPYREVRASDSSSEIAPDILKDRRILLVDDSPDNQVLIQRMLVRRGAKVDFASDGESGLVRAKQNPYDLILMDLQMPGMDGFEATKRLRASGSHVPIVALTAHVVEEVRTQCVEAGCDAFLSKPIQAADLVKTVQELSTHH